MINYQDTAIIGVDNTSSRILLNPQWAKSQYYQNALYHNLTTQYHYFVILATKFGKWMGG